jgi:hypothetical protein
MVMGKRHKVSQPRAKPAPDSFLKRVPRTMQACGYADTFGPSILFVACNLKHPFVSSFTNSLIAQAVQKGVQNLHSSFLLTAQGDRLPQGIGGFPEPFHISLR